MPFDHASPPETPDPRLTLKAKSISERCAAARDLSRYGTPEDIPLLIEQAQNDRSPAVRLGAAGAAADILSRYRVGPRAAQLSTPQRQALFEQFKGMDPDVNAGLFSLLACIGLPTGFERIKSGLRDPRADVRVGAAIGLLRLCASAAAQDDAALEAEVVDLLRGGKLKPDAAAEVAWVAARVGYKSAREPIGALHLSGNQAELVERARELLRGYQEPLRGAYVTDGRDAGEVDPTPVRESGFAVFSAAGAMMGDGDDVNAWTYLDGLLPGGLRRMFIRRVGDAEPGPAFQLEGRTWYLASPERVVAAAEAIARPDELDWAGPAEPSMLEEHAPAVFREALPDDASGDMARGLLLARKGEAEAALQALLAAAERKKKLPRDLAYFLGRALLAAGREAEAREQLEAFVAKGRKKDPRVQEAERLLK